jgi:SAM-dependent methyltransferase
VDEQVQDAHAVEKNKGFFADNEAYARSIDGLETYRNIRAAVNREIAGRRGSSTSATAASLTMTRASSPRSSASIFFSTATRRRGCLRTSRYGDAPRLDEPDAGYDGVLLVMVLHHLVSGDVDGSVDNIRQAIREARRVLEPGARLILVESCVSRRAYAVERRLFGALRAVVSTRLMRHPPTLQQPLRRFESFCESGSTRSRSRRFRSVAWCSSSGIADQAR